jgi:hypothetical protein
MLPSANISPSTVVATESHQSPDLSASDRTLDSTGGAVDPSVKRVPKLPPLALELLKTPPFFSQLGSPMTEKSNEDLIVSVRPIVKSTPKVMSPGPQSIPNSSKISLDHSTLFETLKISQSPAVNEPVDSSSSLEKALRIIRTNITRKLTEESYLASEQTYRLNKEDRKMNCRCFYALGW